MKLVIAIVQERDADRLLTALSQSGIRATRIASAGGFLRRGNATLLIGVEEAQLPEVLSLIETHCRERTEIMPQALIDDYASWYQPDLYEVIVGGATVLVVNVERFERL